MVITIPKVGPTIELSLCEVVLHQNVRIPSNCRGGSPIDINPTPCRDSLDIVSTCQKQRLDIDSVVLGPSQSASVLQPESVTFIGIDWYDFLPT